MLQFVTNNFKRTCKGVLKLKKLIALLLFATILLSMAACNFANNDADVPTDNPEPPKDDSLPSHEHSWSNEYAFDASSHWLTCEGCDATNSLAEHEFNEENYCSVCKQYISVPGVVYELSKDGTYATVADYTGNSTHVVITKEYKGVPVKSIRGKSFYNCFSLTSITIPDSVTSIDRYAFYGCDNLTSIEIPDSVTSIGDSAFSYCSALKTVTFGENSQLSSIGNSVFKGCYRLTSATIPDGVTNIGESAFEDCYRLTSITIPDSVTSIGSSAFYGCDKLVEVYNLSSLNITKGSKGNGYVGYYALNIYTPTSGESKLWTNEDGCIFYEDGDTCYLVGYIGVKTDLTLPESYNGKDYAIYQYAFYKCYSLTSVTFGSGVKTIDSSAFSYCSTLQTITFGENSKLSEIGKSAFYECDSLTYITIPDSVTSIGEGSFCYCNSLTSVTIGKGVTSIGYSAFSRCNMLVEVYNLSSLDITKGSDDNGDVGYYALDIYTSTSEKSKLWTDEDGYVFYEDGDTCYLVGYIGVKTDLTLPESCNGKNYAINQGAFYECDSLTSIEIPDGVETIGEDAFSHCTALKTVTFGKNSQLSSIGDSAFSSCDSLKSITIPNSIETIGNYAFYYCSALKTVTFGENSQLSSIGNSAFENCYRLTSITIPDSVETIGDSAFYHCFALKTVTFGENSQLLSIGEEAFYGCYSLTSITIGKSVTSIGYCAFDGCSSLTSVTIGNSVTSIDPTAFDDCNKLVEVYNLSSLNITKGSKGNGYVGYYALNIYTPTSGESKLWTNGDGYIFYEDGDTCYLVGYTGSETDLTLPESCNGKNYAIYQYAFYECDSLTSITIPDSVTSIGDSAFRFCSSLKAVTFEENSQLSSIGEDAFWICRSLSSITIPDGVTSIGDYAFYDCTGLTSVTIGSGVTSIGKYAFSSCDSLTSVTFKNTEGWSANETSLSAEELSDTEAAAKYLRYKYSDYVWTRS